MHFIMLTCLGFAVAALPGSVSAAATPSGYPPPPAHDRVGTTGCGKPHTPGYHYRDTHGNFSIVSGTSTRYYAVQVSQGYNARQPHPLIFDYHGNGDTSTEQHRNSQYYNYPASQKYVVIYPQGLNRSWEGPSYAVKGTDDLQFTTDLLAHVQAEYCVDPTRVYASGKSNGGGFVDTLACSDHGDSFAAFAMASAALYTDTNRTSCSKKRAILETHGHNDTVISYAGGQGKGGPLPNVGKWVKWWGERNCGLDAKAQVTGDLGGYNITSYSCGGLENVTQHYHFAQLGHCWPNAFADNYDAIHLTSQNCSEVRVLDYTPVVLGFFGKWDLGNAPK
ncbi:hypothetical protein LTR36_007161 [Oleoguttula mirabilis]|uniref:feruloyl esterase n=1 Tax=Oleoguttula mirabilis TaxID=1507867 RepID=A0AAV9JAY8_9PEZI|nr:hypothetical protein LTR36_007161 [Oleoguttula mirabilis]